MKLTLILIFVFLTAWAIWANQVFGPDSRHFDTWGDSFTSLIKLLSGDARFVKQFLHESAGNYVGFYFFYFFLFYFNFVLVLVPLCLAILRDAYAVRHDQLRELKEMIEKAKDEFEKEREKQEKRRRAGYR